MHCSIGAVFLVGMVMHSVAALSRVCRHSLLTSHRHNAPLALAKRVVSTSPPPLYSHDSKQQAAGAEANNDNESNHRKYYSISGTGQRSTVQMETNTGHTLQTDVPTKMGGTNSAAQPVETLLAALLGCTQATAVYVGRMMTPRLIIDKIEFDIEAYRDERGALEHPIDVLPTIPARLQCVSGSVRVYFKKGMNDVTDEQLRTLGEQTEARCPVANMMHASGCVMDMQWVNGNES